MKTIYKLFILLVMVFGVTSCGKDFLDLQPEQSVSDDTFLQNIDDFQTAILGAYDQMQNSDWYGRYFLLVPDVMGEDVKQNASANRAKEWAEYNGSAVDFIPREIWAELYEGINIVNKIINADFVPPDAVKAEYENILGQAYAIRAIAHFDLVRVYAQHYTYTADASHPGIPIVLQYDVGSRPARNTVAEVYNQIISDLQQAIGLMSIDPPNAGYLSKEAAQAIASRVFLYMERWSDAEAMATAVINSGRFTLVDSANYANQFLVGNSPEAIFEIVYNLADNPGSDHLGGMYKETGYGDYLPANDLLNMMDPGDVRSTMFLVDPNLSGIYGSLRVNKYPSAGAEIGTDNLPVIRLSEVYLNRAEARYRLGDEPGARADVNMIRQRGWPAAPDITASGTALLTEIQNERRVELCFEGHSIYDFTRWKKDVVRDDCTSIICTITYPNDRFILPIPEEEMNVNPNITQNPDY